MAVSSYHVAMKVAYTAVGAAAVQAKASSGGGFAATFLNAIGLVLATEFGDKTFFIAAILATQQPVHLVYLGCFGALGMMTFISAIIGGVGGAVLGTVLPKKYAKLLSIALLVSFGVQMIYEALSKMLAEDDDEEDGEQTAEEKEALEQLQQDFYEDEDAKSEISEQVQEVVQVAKSPERQKLEKLFQQVSEPFAYWYEQLLGQFDKDQLSLLYRIFSMNVLAELGDKSQLATIAMASSGNPAAVAIGGLLGHALCTGIAVTGGHILSKQVSDSQMELVGGILFLGFATHSYLSI